MLDLGHARRPVTSEKGPLQGCGPGPCPEDSQYPGGFRTGEQGVSGRGAAGLRGREEGGGSRALGYSAREAHFWEQQAVTSDYSLRPGPALLNDIQEGSSNLSPKGLRAGAAQRTAVLSTHV